MLKTTLIILILVVENIFSFELQNSAHQITEKGIVLSIYGVNGAKDVNFTVKRGQIEPFKIGDTTYIHTSPTESETNFESDLFSGGAGIKATVNPFDGLYYWLKCSYGTMELEIPSLEGLNRFSGSFSWSLSLGLRKLLFPDTLVTPALSFDAGVGFSKVEFDRVETPQRLLPIQTVLSNLEYQIAIIGSKRIKRFEPYGAIEVVRNHSELNDLKNLSKVSGYKDSVGITAGLKFNFYDRESVVIEAGFLGDRYISAGFNLSF